MPCSRTDRLYVTTRRPPAQSTPTAWFGVTASASGGSTTPSATRGSSTARMSEAICCGPRPSSASRAASGAAKSGPLQIAAQRVHGDLYRGWKRHWVRACDLPVAQLQPTGRTGAFGVAEHGRQQPWSGSPARSHGSRPGSSGSAPSCAATTSTNVEMARTAHSGSISHPTSAGIRSAPLPRDQRPARPWPSARRDGRHRGASARPRRPASRSSGRVGGLGGRQRHVDAIPAAARRARSPRPPPDGRPDRGAPRDPRSTAAGGGAAATGRCRSPVGAP